MFVKEDPDSKTVQVHRVHDKIIRLNGNKTFTLIMRNDLINKLLC